MITRAEREKESARGDGRAREYQREKESVHGNCLTTREKERAARRERERRRGGV